MSVETINLVGLGVNTVGIIYIIFESKIKIEHRLTVVETLLKTIIKNYSKE